MGDAADDLTADGLDALLNGEDGMADELVSFDDVTCKMATEKAILCEIDGVEHWFPLSQVDDDSEVYKKGDAGTLVVTQWIAKAKKLV